MPLIVVLKKDDLERSSFTFFTVNQIKESYRLSHLRTVADAILALTE